MTGSFNYCEVIKINIKVNVSENHRVESSRRHIGTTTEHNANILNFNFPAQINEIPVSDLGCNLIFETSDGSSYIYALTSNSFKIPRELTRYNYFDMQVQFADESLDWKSFPVRYELADALNSSNINPSSEQQKLDLAELKVALTDLTGADYADLTWAQALDVIPTLKGTEYYINKVEDYLYSAYYNTLRYKDAYDHFQNHYSGEALGACSSVRNGYFYGRNYDWNYDDKVEFVIATPNKDGRYATIGVASGTSLLTKENIENNIDLSSEYALLPFYMLDGINEYGVIANINVVPTGDNGITYGTNPSAEQSVCSLMLVRYILDNFNSAASAVRGLENINIYSPHSEIFTQELHLMIADLRGTYLVEFINNEIVVTEISSKPYMTNFYLEGVTYDDSGMVEIDSVTPYSMGIERYNIIVENYLSSGSLAGMTNLMRSLFITNSYISTTNPFWYSEYNGDYTSIGYGDLTTSSTPSDYEPIVQHCIELFEDRQRDGRTSQTVHSSVYDIYNKKLYITVQEGSNQHTYGLPVDIISTLNTQEQLDVVQKSLEGNLGSITTPYSSMNWGEIFGDSNNGYAGAIKEFVGIINDTYKRLYSITDSDSDEAAVNSIKLIEDMVTTIHDSIVDCVNEIVQSDTPYTSDSSWDEIFNAINLLPSEVSSQIATAISNTELSLNQEVKTAIETCITELISENELDLTPVYQEDWSDDLEIFSQICNEIYTKSTQEAIDSTTSELTDALADAFEEFTGVSHADKTFSEMTEELRTLEAGSSGEISDEVISVPFKFISDGVETVLEFTVIDNEPVIRESEE